MRNTRALVFRSIFAINWHLCRDISDCIYHMKDLEAYKCKLSDESSSLIPILEPLSLALESHLSPDAAKWTAELDPMNILISYEGLEFDFGCC